LSKPANFLAVAAAKFAFSRSYPQVINNLAAENNPYHATGIDMVTPYGKVVNEKKFRNRNEKTCLLRT